MLEPQIRFKVMNSGISKGEKEDMVSVVPAKFHKEKFIYKKEVPPGICRHVVKTLKESSKDKTLVKKMLAILHALPFDNKCTQQAI